MSRYEVTIDVTSKRLLGLIFIILMLEAVRVSEAGVVKATLQDKQPELVRVISGNGVKSAHVSAARKPAYRLVSLDVKQAIGASEISRQPPVVYIPHASVGAGSVRQVVGFYRQQPPAYSPRSLYQSAEFAIAPSPSYPFQLQQPQQQRRFIRVYHPSFASASQYVPVSVPSPNWNPPQTHTQAPRIPPSPPVYGSADVVAATQPEYQQPQRPTSPLTYHNRNPIHVDVVYVEPKPVQRQLYEMAVTAPPPTPSPAAPSYEEAPVYEFAAKSLETTNYGDNECPSLDGDTCKYFEAGLYAHPTTPTCYLQCDHFGTAYSRPCAPGTKWIEPADHPAHMEPATHNKCS